MWNLIKNSGFIKGYEATGIHLNILQDETWKIHYVRLVRKKNSIQLVSGDEKTGNPADVIQDIHDNSPVCLSIEGKGVIHRKIDTNDNITPLMQVFPNAKPEDFFIQRQQVNDDKTYVSLIRTSLLNKILKFFNDHHITIFKVFAGPFALNCLWTLIKKSDGTLCIENYCITNNGDVITDLKVLPESAKSLKIEFENEFIDSSLLIPYAGALSLFLNDNTGVTAEPDANRTGREQFIYKRLYHHTVFGLLGLLFFVLIINYLFFSMYNRRLNNATQQYRSGIELINRYERLENQLKIRKTIFEETGLLNPTLFSYYADKIASQVPDQIVLTRMQMNPVIESGGVEKVLNTEINKIRITGNCMYSDVLDNWFSLLKAEAWINNIEVLQYKQDNLELPADFIIELVIKS